MPEFREKTDVCIIGAGHAGCEAALACARLGLQTVIFTVNIENIAMMPCNPHIGGSSKGHLVREIDALGGEMGKNIDKTFLQSKMLNKSKGPAVHSLRCQADKAEYSRSMRMILENQENLTIKQTEVCELLLEDVFDDNADTVDNNDADKKFLNKNDNNNAVNIDGNINDNIDGKNDDGGKDREKYFLRKKKIIGVKILTGGIYECKAAILCTGTYLNARCLCGEAITYTGPNGMQSSTHLSKALENAGIKLRRFKTGTPARMDRRSIDFSKMEEQFGDERVVPFSYETDPEDVQIKQESCYLTYTNEETHDIIRANLDRSPIYAGVIEGTGPRYCPSIEDKVVKFSDKSRHQVFIEPEGKYSNEMYVDGMSSSLPEDVQLAMYRTVPGLENCKIVRNAYAIEYDCIDPGQLCLTLEFKHIKGLFSAGQFNGSSGYEEAAAQGLMAGINAVREIQGKEQIVLDRSEAYIGVLIDDLVTKENTEPYRMMTSRAEYRLLLRQDNADLRLRKTGYEVGLISKEQYDHLCEKEKQIKEEIARLKKTIVGASKEVQEFMISVGSSPLRTGSSLAEIICRPEFTYESIAAIDKDRPVLSEAVIEQVNISIKYEGYIERQIRQVEQFKKMERRLIPEDICYEDISGIRIEARQKLAKHRPVSIGQASRISGVSPADISVLLVYISSFRG
ncbi:MAG: tRNA uridine-5-carboxymethylaminomethyl(34) synthesis enzyme MnmG [Lachnospiraceae bacterium]|nr:tRNA uridine-5-carboxymethylaminomethyl(34) synthesis enzyme MnmG [Lachnospiraceae bacterium]